MYVWSAKIQLLHNENSASNRHATPTRPSSRDCVYPKPVDLRCEEKLNIPLGRRRRKTPLKVASLRPDRPTAAESLSLQGAACHRLRAFVEKLVSIATHPQARPAALLGPFTRPLYRQPGCSGSVRPSQGHPLLRAHLRRSRCPPTAAAQYVSAPQGQSFCRAQRRT